MDITIKNLLWNDYKDLIKYLESDDSVRFNYLKDGSFFDLELYGIKGLETFNEHKSIKVVLYDEYSVDEFGDPDVKYLKEFIINTDDILEIVIS